MTVVTKSNMDADAPEGLTCPQCGQNDAFDIDAHGTATVSSDPSYPSNILVIDVGEMGWEGNSPAQCRDCDWEGTVHDLG